MKSGKQQVDAYIAAAPKAAQPMLRQLRRAIRAAVPEADEGLSYRMPYYSYHGRLAYFAAHRQHVSLYAWGRVAERYARQVAKFRSSKSTLRFPFGTRIPVGLVQKLVEARARANRLRARPR
jgi:uncharacterized protein YdhG (YjbR/CyaY superfamily)